MEKHQNTKQTGKGTKTKGAKGPKQRGEGTKTKGRRVMRSAAGTRDMRQNACTTDGGFCSRGAGLGGARKRQVSISGQALIFVTRSRGFSFMERPHVLVMAAFVIAQVRLGQGRG